MWMTFSNSCNNVTAGNCDNSEAQNRIGSADVYTFSKCFKQQPNFEAVLISSENFFFFFSNFSFKSKKKNGYFKTLLGCDSMW